MKKYDRSVHFAGAAFYPVLGMAAAAVITGGVALATQSLHWTMLTAAVTVMASLSLCVVSGLEYYEARRGKNAPLTRIAHNGQRIIDRFTMK